MDIHGYLAEIRALYASGISTEHSFRPALVRLFGSIAPGLTVINEPKHLTDVGAPDFVFNRGEVAIGWCEAKDIGKDVRKFAATDYSKAQKERYKKGLPNLIYTNGLDFEFIRDGEVIDFITVADLIPSLPARAENFPLLENRLRDFAQVTPLSVTSSAKLAAMMAGKAAIIKDIMGRALVADMKARDATGTATDLIGQYEAFKTSLIHDITAEEFADVYAETIAYGLFAARLHDETTDTFTRAEALDLLPKTNPFLRELFIYIAGPNLDERLRRVIDELCHVFCATNMERVLRNFGKITSRQDPFLHFYEDFLAEYNPAKRKARGVWYTPEPVVNFIVRAVDEVLKTEFGLADGLADTSKITIDWDTGQNDPKTGKAATIKKEVHRVQILDPATGTGTFLAEVVKLVSERIKGVAPGQLSAYIERDLIPRLHGFELLMASYAMCHMKLDMILTRLGYKPSANPPRLGVYLTNSLEGGERVLQTFDFGIQRAITEESKQANNIKRQTPIMCVIGNPPYSGHSSNRGAWIEKLMTDYKVSPELKRPAQAKWLSDDYVKFVRLAEHMIEKNGEGVLGFITNHGYLDNPTFLDMRHHLRQTFDRIYVLDLHGNAKKKEVCPDGTPDKNVFDIQQGVAIILGVKRRAMTTKAKPLAQVLHGELWGDRETKYRQLWDGTAPALITSDVSPETAPWRFKPTDKALEARYLSGFSVADLFSPNGRPAPGIVTTHDEFAISWNAAESAEKVERLLATKTEADARQLFRLCSQSQWNYTGAKVGLADFKWRQAITPIAYRPFDTRFTVYNSHVAVHRRERVMAHIFKRQNLALLVTKAVRDTKYAHCFLTDTCNEVIFLSGVSASNAMSLPLYLFPEEGTLDQSIRVNFEPELYGQIRTTAGLSSTPAIPDGTDKFRNATGDARPDEIKVFDYIYGVLHSPAYRATYVEFLKTGFPRIPFPASAESFRAISEQGEALRRLHLMEDAAIGATPYLFHGDGDSVVEKPRHENGNVWINADQYFDDVPAVAWEFHIGGYQPAQKWLKDRKGRVLTYDDIRHYQRMIKILTETDSIMHGIDVPL
jgi:hypothetical protein